ncbi:Cupin 2 domain-containing protein [Desulfonema limicola]|uniref:Cupin 2 domain-containing protein n=1 Tax=Desulfonema limicola TaxID=45656 RepID=A0A975B8E3_9BACT|nr:XRE family transcriptional regulator [Desulfonema limicola]QTA80692.1 Cupin 2 domain-containing protein [Desulfonema limicola]
MDIKNQTPHINVDYFEDLTGDIAETGSDGVDEIGRRLKALREEKGLSLEELAAKTGFDADILEKIETREIYPQLGTVIKLSKSLDAAFGQIISGAGDKPYSITRLRDQKAVSRSTSQKGGKHIYSYKGLAPEVKGRSMEPLIVKLQETPEKEVSTHDGEEFVYVLNGIVLLELGEDKFELEPGDSAYYLSNTPHWIASKSGSATILAVIYGK